MRIAFVALLVCNLLLAAWLLSVSPAGPPEPPPVPENLARLELLAERDRPTQAPDVAQAETAPEPDGGERICYRVGPFPTEADARAVTGRLSGRLAGQELQREQVEDEIGHWVFLPAFPDRASAMEGARRLDEAGLRDYYVITAGDQENTISLGLYRDPENAAGRVRSLQQLGFDAQSRVRTESVPRYHLVLTLTGARAPDWANLLEDYPEAGARRRDCPAA